jgi:hypothetical protein
VAGSGWKLWTRQALPSAQFQSYVQDQVVQRYSSRAARTSVGPASPSEGMMSWLDDEHVLETYTQGSWRIPGPLGRIGYGPQSATGATNTAGDATRITGAINMDVSLFPGRIYEAGLRCNLNASAAGQTIEIIQRISATSGVPAVNDPAVAGHGEYIAVAGGPGQATVAPQGSFQVATAGNRLISPWLRRTAGASGAVSAVASSGTGLLVAWIDDKGPGFRLTDRQTNWSSGSLLTIP